MKIFVDGSRKPGISRMFPVWKKLGHEVIDSPQNGDVQLSIVRIGVKSKLPTIVRLDGLYYDKETDYNKRNTDISTSHGIADGIVYQSRFSQSMAERYLNSRKSTVIFRVIHNGVENSWNNPVSHSGINVVSCAKWRRLKRLPETIEVFQQFQVYFPKAVLHIIGPMARGAEKIVSPGVVYHGAIDFTLMKKIYQTADISLHFCKKDSCPSSVVESIAAGISTITTSACGGATEMCNISEGCFVIDGEEVTTNPDFIYQDPYNVMPKKVQEKIVSTMKFVIDHSTIAVLPKELTIDYTAKQYIKIMENVLKR